MIVTEEEAKTKACCGQRCGKYEPENDRYVCIGSACMAWRWVMRPFDVTKNDWMEDSHAVDANEAIEWRRLGGYCGKAGKP